MGDLPPKDWVEGSKFVGTLQVVHGGHPASFISVLTGLFFGLLAGIPIGILMCIFFTFRFFNNSQAFFPSSSVSATTPAATEPSPASSFPPTYYLSNEPCSLPSSDNLILKFEVSPSEPISWLSLTTITVWSSMMLAWCACEDLQPLLI